MIARIQAERAVRTRQERLAAIGQLTASVAHELRNPLGTIRTACYVISGQLRGQRLDVERPLDAVEHMHQTKHRFAVSSYVAQTRPVRYLYSSVGCGL